MWKRKPRLSRKERVAKRIADVIASAVLDEEGKPILSMGSRRARRPGMPTVRPWGSRARRHTKQTADFRR